METYGELRKKEVINVCDGMRLGFINDLEISLPRGQIVKIIVSQSHNCFNFFCCEKEEYCIPWACIKKIGDDIILVDVNAEDVMCSCERE